MAADDAAGRLAVATLPGIAEIVPGDNLPTIVAEALGAAVASGGALVDLAPLRADDVVVVTSKVVSKAEGAIVDLATIEPRPEAVAFAERWDRDARQIEVVLREARRVVRMANGVLITETAHGFICANGGVDASNVGPRSGDIVLLLPRDPDASAAAIRAAIRAIVGIDLAVIVSDSFGRPWRWGITDVAIGVSGIAPIDDLRGTPDADGRVMRATIRAVADEIASAAELALGKVGGRPVALVRGAAPDRRESSIGEALIPAASDLFR
ncbi:MAG: coenzyme F420-0:L-glutamate ligase [Candidatus Limnocylindrales bacterium]